MAGNAKSLERTIIEGLIGALERAYVPARLGRINSDGTVTTKVDGRPGYVWVRLGPEGELGPAVAYNKGVPLRPHLPVRLLQIRGQWVIQEVDHTGGRLEAFLGGGGAISSVPYHTHRTKTGLEYEVEAIRLEPGRVRSVGGMIVAINPFRYQTQGGGWETWPGGNLDLTAYKPATSGHHAWVVVGIDPDTNTAVAVTGASQATSSALTTSQIDDVDVGGMIPLMAIQVANDDTALTSFSKYRDARGWLNRNFVQTLDDLQDVVVTLPQDGDKLVYSDDYGYWFNSGDSGSVGALDDLSDVNITGLLDEDILMFDSGTGQWVNVPYGSVAYLKLAGDAGGQLANGGVAAGEFLWLRGTAHATPGPIFLNDLGGGVSIGSNSNPSEDLVVENNILTRGDYIGSGLRPHSTPNYLTIDDRNSQNGAHHRFVTMQDVSDSLSTVIENGTGDVTTVLLWESIVTRSGVTQAKHWTTGGGAVVPGGTDVDIFDDGTNIWRLDAHADGSAHVYRFAGTGTAHVHLRLMWT